MSLSNKVLKCLLIVLTLLMTPLSYAGVMGISQPVFELMAKAQEHVDAENWQEAEKIIKSALSRKRLNEHEQAQLWNLQASVNYQQAQYPAAEQAFKKVLDYEKHVPPGLVDYALKAIVQLSFATDNYQNALDYALRLSQKQTEPDAMTHLMLAQAYYNLKHYEKALPEIKTAISLDEANGNVAKENWLLILNAIHYSRGDYKSMAKTLERIVSLYPDARHILNLASIYGQLEESKKQLALVEPLIENGTVEGEAYLLNLASLYLHFKVPFKAASLLENKLETNKLEKTKKVYDMLAQAWQMSAEPGRSIPSLNKSADLAENGNGYIRLANQLINLRRWQEAEVALGKALKKGDLRDKPGAYLMLGMTRFHQKQYKSARSAFSKAKNNKKTEKFASQWLRYIASEEKKLEALN